MYTEFYKDRPFIENEYENAEWDAQSGLSPDEIDKMIRAYAAENPKTPPVILAANCYKILLDNAQLGVNPHTMFPDKLRCGATYATNAKPSVFEYFARERYENTFMRRCPAIWAQRNMLRFSGVAVPDTDVWHVALDWKEVLRLGAKGLYDRAVAQRAAFAKSGEMTLQQQNFFDAVITVYASILGYMHRLLDASKQKGLLRYAEALENLCENPPKTLYEVLCLSHIMLTAVELGRERCRTYGPVDELWSPYYTADLTAGRETKDSVKEMFRYFWQKVAAEKRYADQPICIGKAWESDDCPAVELTMLMLEAYQELGVHNPKIHIRCKKNLSDKLLTKLCEMIRSGSSSVVLINDEAVIRAYEAIGIPREVANEFVPLGCYESHILGKEDSRICASWINLEKACEYAITGGHDMLTHLYVGSHAPEPKTWEEFLSTYYHFLAEHIEMVMNNVNEQAYYTYEANPSPILSGTHALCMEKGKDYFDGAMQYRNASLKCFAIASAVDSLLAVKKYVFEKKRVTLSELRAILESNWDGADALRNEIIADPVKYGNNIAEADDLARNIFDFCAEHIIGKPTSTGGVFRLGCDSVNMAEGYGMRTAASADGRLAREPLSKNMRPVNGRERRGVTAFIQSVCHLHNEQFVDGAPLDFMVHPSAVEGTEGLEAMKTLIRVFFQNGGMAIQGNIISLDTLLDAQAHPENYPHLQVRVCGWNEYFVNMNAKVQTDFINRMAGIES